MSFKKLLPLLVILIVLAALGLLKRGSQNEPTIESQADLTALVSTDLDAADIERLELFAAAKPDEKVVLKKNGDTWVVDSHFDAPATGETIEAYLEQLVDIKGEFRASADTDETLADYSLKDDEAFHVLAYTAAGEEPAASLLFGKAPGQGTVFVRQAGDNTVYVESANLRQEAGLYGEDLTEAPKADKWLDKEALALDKEAITKIALTTPDKSLLFEKQEKEVPQPEAPETPEGEQPEQPPAPPATETEWVMTSGGEVTTFKDAALQNVLNKLAGLTASTIVDPDKAAEWGLDSPGFKAVVSREGEEDVIIEGGRPDPAGNGYVRVAGNEPSAIYELSTFNFDQLFPKGPALVDLPAWEVEKEAISEVTIARPEGRIVLSRAGDQWNVVEPASNLAEQQATIDSLIGAVAAWTPADYADNSVDPGDLDRTVQVTANGNTRTFSVGGQARGADGAYARIEGQEETLVMKAADIEKVFVQPRDLYERTLFAMTPDDVTRIDFRLDGKSAALRQGDNAWTLNLEETDYTVDSESADKLLDILLEMQAADIDFGGTPSDIAEIGAVSIVTRNGSSKLLTIGEEAEGTHPIAVSGMQNTFSVAAPDIDRLKTTFEALKESRGEAQAPSAEALPETAAPMPAEAPAPEAPAADAPAPEAPAAEAPAAEAPAPEAAAAEAPATEAPAAEAPAAEAPAAEAPAAEVPAADFPAADSPADAPQS